MCLHHNGHACIDLLAVRRWRQRVAVDRIDLSCSKQTFTPRSLIDTVPPRRTFRVFVGRCRPHSRTSPRPCDLRVLDSGRHCRVISSARRYPRDANREEKIACGCLPSRRAAGTRDRHDDRHGDLDGGATACPRESSWLSLPRPLHTVQHQSCCVRMIRVKPIKVSVALASATRIG